MQQQLSVVGIDLAKRVFHVAGMDDKGKIVLRKRLTREALLPFLARLSPVVIGMEACGGAHYWGRRFREHGHTVKLIAPQFVKPYVKSNKNDPADAEAICEAMTRPTMRFVPVKEIDQQDLQALHRARERVVKARTALVNEIRGLLGEYGIVLPQSVTKFRNGFLAILEAERAKLTALGQELFGQLYEEFGALFRMGGSLPRGLVWCRDNIPRAASRVYWGLVNAVMSTSVPCSSTVHARRCAGSDSRRIAAVSGSAASSTAGARTRRLWHSPTKTRGLPGCC
jgi:Transposase